MSQSPKPNFRGTRVGSGRDLFPPGTVNPHSWSARRYKEIYEEFADELRCRDKLSAVQTMLLRCFSTIAIELEQLDAAFLSGKDSDRGRHLSLSYEARNLLHQLGFGPSRNGDDLDSDLLDNLLGENHD